MGREGPVIRFKCDLCGVDGDGWHDEATRFRLPSDDKRRDRLPCGWTRVTHVELDHDPWQTGPDDESVVLCTACKLEFWAMQTLFENALRPIRTEMEAIFDRLYEVHPRFDGSMVHALETQALVFGRQAAQKKKESKGDGDGKEEVSGKPARNDEDLNKGGAPEPAGRDEAAHQDREDPGSKEG